MIDCTERALTEAHLNNYPKETLIQFIMKHRQKLLEGVKKHKRDYNKQPKKAHDFDSQPKVRVALKFSYLGMDYKGLVIQQNVEDTVEGRIFEAMRKICLINPDE
jgi:hypothetical protein